MLFKIVPYEGLHVYRSGTHILLLLVFLLVAGCGPSRETFDPPRTLKGQIMMVGNEPFTSLAVAVGEDKVYLIHCSENTKTFLLSNQGKFATLVYNEIRKTERGEELEVLSATIPQ